MPLTSLLVVAALILAVAIAYSAVGNAGALAYLAAMALFGIDPGAMKPTALALNVLVALIAFARFQRAGCFSWRLFWPFAVASVPFAFIGGGLALPGAIYKLLVGCVLLFSAWWLFHSARRPKRGIVRQPPNLGVAMLVGAAIGLLSGLTGVGGGVFLSPLLLVMGWADMGLASGVAAGFVLVNSIAGLSGLLLGSVYHRQGKQAQVQRVYQTLTSLDLGTAQLFYDRFITPELQRFKPAFNIKIVKS